MTERHRPVKQKPIEQRITEALASGKRTYSDVMLAVFPPERYPKAWRYQSNGGPPGCAMAFGAALRRMGVRVDYGGAGRHSLSHRVLTLTR